MENRLLDAVLNNDFPTFIQLLQQDPLILDKTNLNCEDKNPLHVAAMQGNVGIIQYILAFPASYYMCFARDRDGRNPLHLAAMYGKLEALQVLIRAVLPAALEKADGGGTILHLCVKFNQLEALKLLADILKDRNFVNALNEEGMTILHQAIYYQHKQIAKYLLEDAVAGVNVKNSNGETAMDLLLAQGEFDREILSCLEEAEGLKGKKVRDPNYTKTKQREWYEKSREGIMVVASLIATMAFQAGVSPPGGVWADDSPDGPMPHRIGQAVLAQTHPKYYRHLIRANSIAFVSSLSTIILLIRGSGIRSKHLMPLLAYIMHLSITTIAITYAVAIGVLAPETERGHLSIAGLIAVVVLMVWSGWMVTVGYEINDCCKRRAKFKGMMEKS